MCNSSSLLWNNFLLTTLYNIFKKLAILGQKSFLLKKTCNPYGEWATPLVWLPWSYPILYFEYWTNFFPTLFFWVLKTWAVGHSKVPILKSLGVKHLLLFNHGWLSRKLVASPGDTSFFLLIQYYLILVQYQYNAIQYDMFQYYLTKESKVRCMVV